MDSTLVWNVTTGGEVLPSAPRLRIYDVEIAKAPRRLRVPAGAALERLEVQSVYVGGFEGPAPTEALVLEFCTLAPELWMDSLAWLQRCPLIEVFHCTILEAYPGMLGDVLDILPQLSLIGNSAQSNDASRPRTNRA